MTSAASEILSWYDRHRRTLPWRAKPGVIADPYKVWLSEIMLQQTTVATVKTYYETFTARWPTVGALATAPMDAILKEWAGLGYYARARNLHKCAVIVAEDYGGKFPETEAELLKLPGIGAYTAAAIAAIAFDAPAAVVDGNIERIISRLYRIDTPLPKAKKPIKERVAAITPNERPGDFAQAMMDLGSGVCTPKKPDCLLCPWQGRCEAQTAGDMTAYPVKPPKKVKPTRRAVSFWIEQDSHILFERRPGKGLLGGMPGFFSTPWVERIDFPDLAEAREYAPIMCDWRKQPGIAKHTFTHFHLETVLYAGHAGNRANVENGFWLPVKDIEGVGLPTVFSKIAALRQGEA